jgi:glycosyltransferase involved in cell wall biosynthesis
MDSAALTGGCHYFWECKGYMTGCGKCPALYSDNINDQTAINFKYKYNYLSKTDINIIAGTEWQYLKAKNSLMFRNKPIYKIFLSVEPEIFKPITKNIPREKLSIPSGKKVVFFGSVFLTEKRKGMLYLIEALHILKEKYNDLENNMMLLFAGNNVKDFTQQIPFTYKHLGFLKDCGQLAEAFQAADMFVCPSIEEAGPMMINQSLMCGTPVVAFEMGVANDLVISGKTGYRAKLRDSDDFANGINKILNLNSVDYLQMSNNCRNLALEMLHPNVQIKQFENIFIS